MSILVGGDPHPILSTDTYGGKPAESVIALRLGAANRWMAEGLGGALVNNGMPKVHPGTPMQGKVLPGHDHSGGIMGVPQKCTVWRCPFGYAGTANCTYEVAPNVTVNSGITTPEALVDTVHRNIFVPGGKAYRTLDFQVRFGATAAADYGIKVYGGNGDGPYPGSGTLSVGDSTVTVSGIPFVPGRINSMKWSVYIQYAAATATVSLVHAALHQSSTAV